MPPCDADPAPRADPDAPPPRRPGHGTARRTAPPLALAMAAEPATPWLVRNRVRAWLEQLAWPAELVDDIEYAVSEAVSNVAEHAYGPEMRGGPVEVLAAVETTVGGGRRVRVRVGDSGRWQPIEPNPALRGRGLFMMHTLMDEVTIRRGEQPGDGTEVVMLSPVAPPAPGDGGRGGG